MDVGQYEELLEHGVLVTLYRRKLHSTAIAILSISGVTVFDTHKRITLLCNIRSSYNELCL
jgi:hypothetical protein